MIFPILFAILLAKIKGFAIKPLFKAYTLYPFAILTVILLYLQLSVFFQNYNFIKYASVIKTLYLFSLIVPFLYYKLFKPGLIGALLIILGTFLNKFVMRQNGGKMPVYATFSKLTGYYNEAIFQTADTIHQIGDSSVKSKVLTDYIDIGYSILSIGDLLIHSFVFIILYFALREIHQRNSLTATENEICG